MRNADIESDFLSFFRLGWPDIDFEKTKIVIKKDPTFESGIFFNGDRSPDFLFMNPFLAAKPFVVWCEFGIHELITKANDISERHLVYAVQLGKNLLKGKSFHDLVPLMFANEVENELLKEMTFRKLNDDKNALVLGDQLLQEPDIQALGFTHRAYIEWLDVTAKVFLANANNENLRHFRRLSIETRKQMAQDFLGGKIINPKQFFDEFCKEFDRLKKELLT